MYYIFCMFYSFFFNIGYSQQVEGLQQESTIFLGTTVIEQVYSPGLEGNLLGDPATQPVKVYLPPGYNDYPNNRYPVIYLLHGHAMNYNSFYSWNGILDILNELISNRTIAPVIFVTPNGTNKYTGSMYTNSYASGNWEDFIVRDVIQYVENKYRILDQAPSRGLGGFSSGGYGALKIAMKHPYIYGSMCTIGISITSFKEKFLDGPGKESMIEAVKIDKWDSGLSQKIKNRFSNAVAFAPDSTAKPALGRFPFTAEGVFVDSTWQEWLMHDPFTMFQTQKDSLLKLYAIQMYVGSNDFTQPQNELFHQVLLDHGIEHGYEIYPGDHNAGPVLDDLLIFFSENLVGVVPSVRLLSDYYLENTDILVSETDMDGKLYIVPFSAGNAADSIYKYQVAITDASANEENEFQLSEIEVGRYRVFAVNSDSAISNISEEFYVVPDKSLPLLSLDMDTVNLGDSMRVTSSRDGTICLLSSTGRWVGDTLHTASQIMNSSKIVESADALAGSEVSFSTDGLTKTEYWIYGFDQYGIVAGPISVHIQPVSTIEIVGNPPKIAVFPNPAKESVTVQTTISTVYDIVITSINGQLIYQEGVEGTIHQIDLSPFQKGVYFITIRSKDYVTTKKIIKM